MSLRLTRKDLINYWIVISEDMHCLNMWEGKIYLTAPPENVLPEPQGQHQWSSDDEHTRTRYKSCKSNLYTKSKQESDNSKRRTTDTTYDLD